MTNPISPIGATQIPHVAQQITNQDGTATDVFYRFMVSLLQRTGGASGVNSSDTQEVAQNALTIASAATQEAGIAQGAAQQAQTDVDALTATVTLLSTEVAQASRSASNASQTALQAVNNLSDVTNVSDARSNLDLDTYPAVYQFDTFPTPALRRGLAIWRSVQVPAAFAGANVWWNVAPTSDATFFVSSKTSVLGTIVIAKNGTGVQYYLPSAVSLNEGDALIVSTPSPSDSTLAGVCITLPLTLL